MSENQAPGAEETSGFSQKRKTNVKKIKPGCCACCNEKCCGGGCFDVPEGPCCGRMWNCNGCCDRGRVLVRRSASLTQSEVQEVLQAHKEFKKQRERRQCC